MAFIGFNFTDINSPIISSLGREYNRTFSGKNLIDIPYMATKIIDTGSYFYYFMSMFSFTDDLKRDITINKISYDLNYVESCISYDIGVSSFLLDLNYTFQEMTNMTFNWVISNQILNVDSISSSIYNFSDSPYSIWPRPYSKEYFADWVAPSSYIVFTNNTFSLKINDTMSTILIQVSEQWQDVPINQTSIQSISPDIQFSYLNFLQNGLAQIDWSSINEVGVYSVTIKNQLKLMNQNNTNFRVIDYLWDNQMTFQIELINDTPQLQANLRNYTINIDEDLSFSLTFSDSENDTVNFEFQSLTWSITDTSTVVKVNNNNYNISWTPITTDLGINTINLIYYDRFHQNSASSIQFTIEVTNITNPYFKDQLKNINVLAGVETNYLLPEIVNPSSLVLNLRYPFVLIYSVTVLNQDSNVINAADWVSLDELNILINPKCDLVINITSIEFTIKVNILPSLSDSFKLTVNQNKEIWNKENVWVYYNS